MSKKKPIQPPVLSASRDLVPVGPRHVQTKYQGKRDENGLKPSTSRALVLRNGKFGARGTGEVMLAGRMSGREKLDLLAEDLVSQKSQTAVMSPLKLEKCVRIADSQFNAYLDDIADLKDPDLFYDKIKAEIAARTPYGTAKGVQEVLQNASYVASVVATRVHNAYMVASGWKLILDILRALEKSGLNDATTHIQLQKDEALRSWYLVLCDIVSVLVDLGQTHFSVLAMTTPHYARYFKDVENMQSGEPSIAFDWAGLKDACKSFIDSIIIELCFPKAPYPKRILYQILHDAVDESPREAKRFPQKMWDAVGDLSVTLELQELLAVPLMGPQGEKLKALPRPMPEQYEMWLDAQIYSKRASESYVSFKDLISPLEKTKDRTVLDNMWRFINLNYKSTSNQSVDSLWQLDEALRRTPQWSSFYMPNLRTYAYDSDDQGMSNALVKSTGPKRNETKKRQKKLLAITDGRADDDDDSNGSMPGLQSVSDSSDESDEDMFGPDNDAEFYEDDDSGYDDESDYDSEDEELYRSMLREAMDTAMAIPEFFDPKTAVPEFDALTEEGKGNPFLKLLGSLRGRMFSSDPKLSSTSRVEPRKDLFGAKLQAAKAAAGAPLELKIDFSVVPDDDLPPLQPLTVPRRKRAMKSVVVTSARVPAPQEPKDRRATVEDVEDAGDDAASAVSKKKKKKKKPKKKRTGTGELTTVQEDSVPATPATPTKALPGLAAQSPSRSPTTKPSITNASLTSLAHMSAASLPIEPTTAQSGRSYLQELGAPKEKVKSRPDHASLFSEKRGFLSKLSGRGTAKTKEDKPNINKKFTWFSKLGKKTTSYMQQLLRTGADEKAGSLKWENFVKVMRDMGFEYDPSTAGSSVRFDPPDSGDRSITFHKPHPDPTLHPNHLREFGKKLKEYYGWSEEDFLKRTSNI
ncbi:hypothetical protein PAXRUDRAFT_830231 [Paxillus rubicundulus Ve08.2h10]|uniref:Uncharacterized protein n=1 Tax=Paxillus rubicundulus Ve08.2h10 TaxID=930991 RepID=A0A0D0DLF5_9AGAM|nr:hypothetical protein PAXRUDRAFT_830231 [Paxillus rubicundulus Ve08.2h10]